MTKCLSPGIEANLVNGTNLQPLFKWPDPLPIRNGCMTNMEKECNLSKRLSLSISKSKVWSTTILALSTTTPSEKEIRVQGTQRDNCQELLVSLIRLTTMVSFLTIINSGTLNKCLLLTVLLKDAMEISYNHLTLCNSQKLRSALDPTQWTAKTVLLLAREVVAMRFWTCSQIDKCKKEASTIRNSKLYWDNMALRPMSIALLMIRAQMLTLNSLRLHKD